MTTAVMAVTSSNLIRVKPRHPFGKSRGLIEPLRREKPGNDHFEHTARNDWRRVIGKNDEHLLFSRCLAHSFRTLEANGDTACGEGYQARISFTTRPWTSVSR